MSKISINGYVLDEDDLTTNDSGFSRWGYAEKNNQIYFIKQFLSPVYPENESIFSPRQLEAKKKGCRQFEEEKTKIYQKINEASDGNSVCIEEMFRYGSKYFITMKKINDIKFQYDRSYATANQRIRLGCILAHGLMSLHENGVVHGDMKWSNLMFTQSAGKKAMTVKLIDFDNSFLTENPPRNYQEFNFDQVYCAPETFMFSNEAEIDLGPGIDVFAYGIILYQLLSGTMPVLSEGFRYVYEAVISGDNIGLKASLPPNIRNLILDTLKKDPKERPTMREVYNVLAPLAGFATLPMPGKEAAENPVPDDKPLGGGEATNTDKQSNPDIDTENKPQTDTDGEKGAKQEPPKQASKSVIRKYVTGTGMVIRLSEAAAAELGLTEFIEESDGHSGNRNSTPTGTSTAGGMASGTSSSGGFFRTLGDL